MKKWFCHLMIPATLSQVGSLEINKISGSAGSYFLFSLIHCHANILPNAQGIEHDITETG